MKDLCRRSGTGISRGGRNRRRLLAAWGMVALSSLLIVACSPLDRGGSNEEPAEIANESQFVIVTVTIALSPTPRLSESTYVVQEGDTLSGIAEMFGVSWDAIIVANNLQSQDSIFVGQELLIPIAATPEP